MQTCSCLLLNGDDRDDAHCGFNCLSLVFNGCILGWGLTVFGKCCVFCKETNLVFCCGVLISFGPELTMYWDVFKW